MTFISRGLKENTKESLAKILFIIKQAPGIHLRAIARVLKMNPFTVSTLADRYLLDFIETRQDDRYGLKTKVFTIKEGKENATITDVLENYELRKRIRGSNSETNI